MSLGVVVVSDETNLISGTGLTKVVLLEGTLVVAYWSFFWRISCIGMMVVVVSRALIRSRGDDF